MGSSLDQQVRAVFCDDEILEEPDILSGKDDDIDILFHVVGIDINERSPGIGIGLAEERDLGIEYLFRLFDKAADRF